MAKGIYPHFYQDFFQCNSFSAGKIPKSLFSLACAGGVVASPLSQLVPPLKRQFDHGSWSGPKAGTMLQCCYSPVSPNTIGMAKWRSLRKSRIQFLGQHPRSLHLMEGHRDKLPHPTPHRILSWSCLSSYPVQVQETNHTLYTDAALILFLLRNSHLNLYLNLSFCNCLVVYLFCQSQWWVNARTIVLIYDIFPYTLQLMWQ